MSTATTRLRNKIMEFLQFLIPVGIVAIWLILQIWVLPRMGVKT